MVKDFVLLRLKLPKVIRLRIKDVPKRDKELNRFLLSWIPTKLDFILINYNECISGKGIKIDFYLDSISYAIQSATKGIYLCCFEISEAWLEYIIKSAFNWEKLVLYYWDIHCSKMLDFSIYEKYNIKYLSFYGCGNTRFSNRNSDWKKTHSSIKNIVEAISKWDLRFSLKTFDISLNQTLIKDKIQSMFNDFGLSHVKVVINWQN